MYHYLALGLAQSVAHVADAGQANQNFSRTGPACADLPTPQDLVRLLAPSESPPNWYAEARQLHRLIEYDKVEPVALTICGRSQQQARYI